jgi:hypothetical protein
MARPIVLTTTGVSASSVCPLCFYTEKFNVSVNTVVTGSATYTLQFTADDPFAATFTPASANWKSHPSMTDATTGDIVEFTAPVRAVRINQTVGTGSVRATVIQMDV